MNGLVIRDQWQIRRDETLTVAMLQSWLGKEPCFSDWEAVGIAKLLVSMIGRFRNQHEKLSQRLAMLAPARDRVLRLYVECRLCDEGTVLVSLEARLVSHIEKDAASLLDYISRDCPFETIYEFRDYMELWKNFR